jgi:hypothetical protein
MKGVWPKLFSLSTLALLIITLFPAPAAKAQTRPNGPTPLPAPRAPDAGRPSIKERQLKMDEMAREAARPRTTEEERLAPTRIAEDFRTIQILNNKMMNSTMKAATPDYGSIATTTAEIRKRANRIRNNLSLPRAVSQGKEKKPGHKAAVDAAGMKAALLSLEASIMSFVENPIFKNLNLMDVEQATKAGRDLEGIIESSRLISKDAEQLGNPSKKEP